MKEEETLTLLSAAEISTNIPRDIKPKAAPEGVDEERGSRVARGAGKLLPNKNL